MKKNYKIKLSVLIFTLLTVSLYSQSLLKAVQENDLEAVKIIVNNDLSQIIAEDAAGRQAIHFAANKGNLKILSFLIKKGADPASETAAGTSVLHFAAIGGHTEVVKLLLEKDIPFDKKNRGQITPLYYAAMRGHEEVVSLLLDKNADPDAYDTEKGTPLQAAALNGHLNIVRLLSESGAAVKHRDLNGRTALHFACQTDNIELIEFLLRSGLDMTIQDRFGKTGLFYAVENGKIPAARKISDSYPELFIMQSNNGSTCLHAAVLGGAKELTAIVVDQGVKLDIKDRYGLTAWDYALHNKDTVLIEYLQDIGAKNSGFDKIELKDQFPDRALPGLEPELFAPGIISTPFANERDVCFSNEFSELYFTRWLTRKWDIKVMHKKDEIWSTPVTTPFSSPWMEAEAFLTPDEKQIFFLSNRPESGEGQGGPWEIWTTARFRTGWTEPQKLGKAFTGGFYTTFTREGTMHLTLDGNMQFARKNGDKFEKPRQLPQTVNGDHGGYNGFVAPDESYLIFTTFIEGEGYGQGDLYITFRQPDGSWTRIVNMGHEVNSFAQDYCPSVSPDGKYFFFSSRRLGTEDIFWMDAGIIYELQKNNIK